MPSETYRFEVQGISTGEQTQNVWHFLCDNNDDATPIEVALELVGAWNAQFREDWLVMQSNRYALRWIQAKRITPAGGNSYWQEYPEGSEAGAVNEEQGVLQCAPIMKMFAGIATNVQGRCFLPPPPDSAVVNNSIAVGYNNDMVAFFADMIAFSGSDHDFALAVYSRKLTTGFPVTTVTMSNIIGCQGRRRKPLS